MTRAPGSGQMQMPGACFGRRVGMRIKRTHPVEKIVQVFESRRGAFVSQKSRNAARAHAKQALEAGYTLEEVLGCMQWLDTESGTRSLSWSLAFVGRKLPDWRRMQAAAKSVAEQVEQVPEGWKW